MGLLDVLKGILLLLPLLVLLVLLLLLLLLLLVLRLFFWSSLTCATSTYTTSISGTTSTDSYCYCYCYRYCHCYCYCYSYCYSYYYSSSYSSSSDVLLSSVGDITYLFFKIFWHWNSIMSFSPGHCSRKDRALKVPALVVDWPCVDLEGEVQVFQTGWVRCCRKFNNKCNQAAWYFS